MGNHRFDLNSLKAAEEEKEFYRAEGLVFSGRLSGDGALLRFCQPYRAVYGMGERFNRVNQKGLTVETEVFEKFCNQGEASYCPVPFFFTDLGAGVYVDTLTVVRFSFGDHTEIRIRRGSDGKLPQVYLFLGTPGEILGSFSEVTGKPRAVPKWSLGPWMSANRWHTQEETQEQLCLAKKLGFPHTVLVLEAWSDEATFYRFNEHGEWEDPEGLVRELKQEGLRLILWQIPVLKRMDQGENHPVLDEDWAYAQEHGLCIRKKDGTPYHIPEGHWFAGSLLPDFSNPDTVKWWFGKREYLLSMGVDGFKTDGGEFILTDDAVSCDGHSGLELRNAFASRYVQAYAEFIGKDRVLFSRAGYTGQQKMPIQWAGDQMSTWEELGHVLTAGLSIGLSGVPLWGFDIGGFAGFLPEEELYERAVQMAVFVPVMQWHSEPVGGQFAELFPGSKGINDRSPWNLAEFYGDAGLLDRLRFWFRLRMNLLPYLYHQCLLSCASGLPMMRHLVIEYPRDEKIRDDCFMLGDLLVAPVLEKGQRIREVYLPEGEWECLWPVEAQKEEGSLQAGLTRLSGGSTYRIRCVPERIPVFLREGGCIALNLGEGCALGSDVGNSVDRYRQLCFYPSGREGKYRFRDDLGNEILIRWKDGQAAAERIAGAVDFRILDRIH